jgi:hypothetical protein
MPLLGSWPLQALLEELEAQPYGARSNDGAGRYGRHTMEQGRRTTELSTITV